MRIVAGATTPAPMSAIITLTSDFGLQDSYVAQMKGEILKIAPQVRLVDVTHEIQPQDVRRAAIVLREIVPSFPAGTVHLAVVDPGVGSARRPVAVEMADQRFVGPDNGLFALIARDWPPRRVVQLDRPETWRARSDPRPQSYTFHGRDVFAPVAARCSLGIDLESLGTLTTEPLCPIDWPDPQHRGNHLVGEVIAIDRFGNLMTNVPASWLQGARPDCWTFRIGQHSVAGLHCYYAEVDTQRPIALIGSSGLLEIAVRDGSAAHQWGVSVGNTVVCQAQTDEPLDTSPESEHP